MRTTHTVQIARKTQACQNPSEPADRNKARAKHSTKKARPKNDFKIKELIHAPEITKTLGLIHD
jgi:hypothetical protein